MEMKEKTDTALSSVSKLQDSNAMNMWSFNIAQGLKDVPQAEFVSSEPASRKLLAPMSSADDLSGVVRSSLMSAIAAAMGASVTSTDNVLESIQSLAAVTGSGPMTEDKQIQAMDSAITLALSVQGERITGTSVERFIDTLTNLKPTAVHPVQNADDQLKQLVGKFELCSHLIADAFLKDTMPGEAPVIFDKGGDLWLMMKVTRESLGVGPISISPNELFFASAPAISQLPPLVNLRLVSSSLPFHSPSQPEVFVTKSIAVGFGQPGKCRASLGLLAYSARLSGFVIKPFVLQEQLIQHKLILLIICRQCLFALRLQDTKPTKSNAAPGRLTRLIGRQTACN